MTTFPSPKKKKKKKKKKRKMKKTTFPCSNGIDLHIMISKSNNWSTLDSAIFTCTCKRSRVPVKLYYIKSH